MINYPFRLEIDAVNACNSFYTSPLSCLYLWRPTDNKVISGSGFIIGNEDGVTFTWKTANCNLISDQSMVDANQASYLGQCIETDSQFFQFEPADIGPLIGYIVLAYVSGYITGMIKVWFQRGIEII